MRAIVLAAGKGTRLRPLTNDKPKCMVELLGKPLIQRQLEVLNGADIQDIVMVGGYKSEHLKPLGTKLVVNTDYDTTNMVKTLFCAEELMDTGQDLIISYGDIVFDSQVLDSVINNKAELAVAVDKDWLHLWSLRMEDPLSDAETLIMDDGLNILELGKPPQSYNEVQGQYIGLIKVRADKVNEFINAWRSLDPTQIYDGKDIDNMYMTSFIQHLIDTNWEVKAAPFAGGWLEVDTVEDLNCYEKLIRQNKLVLASFS